MTGLRALKSRWVLLLVLVAMSLGVNHYFQDNAQYSSYADSIYNFISGSGSRGYVRVVKISDKVERRGGTWYATIYVTVKNISKKVVTELGGKLNYVAGKRQSATIQYRGKIPPGGQEKITLYVQIPRSGGFFGKFKVKFTKVEVQ